METIRKMRKSLAGLSVLAIAAFAWTGCSSNSNSAGNVIAAGGTCGGLGSTGFSGTSDIAVGDDVNDVVALFLDVLNNPDTNDSPGVVPPAADVVLDNTGSGIDAPNVVYMHSDAATGNDLYVGNFGGGGSIAIFRDYLGLADGAAPDVVLDGTADIVVPADILVTANDQLVVADGSALTSCCANYTTSGEDEVIVFADASAIAADVAPDLILDNGTSLIDNPISIAVAANSDGNRNDLFVAMAANTGGNPLVTVYEDLDTLVTNGVAVAPDAALNEDTSFLDLGSTALKVHVYNNNLYVGVESSGTSVGTEVFIFEGADSLTDDQLPDAVLFGNDSYVDWPSTLATSTTVTGTDLLFVGDLNYDVGVCTNSPGLAMFTNPENLQTGNAAAAALSQDTSNLGFATHMAFGGNALFVSGSRENCDLTATDIIIFRNAANGLCNGSAPNIIISGSATAPAIVDFGEVAQPRGLAVAARDLGT